MTRLMPLISFRSLIALSCPVIAYFISHYVALNPTQTSVTFLALWMILWWLTEVVPLYITSLLPILFLPLLTELPLTMVLQKYVTEIFFLFLGGFIFAEVAEKWKAHEYFANLALRKSSTRAHVVILIFMGITGFLSMWISNSASALLMMPLVRFYSLNESRDFNKALLFGVGYAASIGGIATLTGSPPNAMAAAFARSLGGQLTYFEWMSKSLPFAVVGLIILWLIVTRVFYSSTWKTNILNKNIQHKAYNTSAIRRIAALLIILVVALVLIPTFQINVSESTFIFGLSLALFLIPAKKNERLLQPKDLRKIPWGVLVLFGGGIALSHALTHSGLTDLWVSKLNLFSNIPPYLGVFGIVCFFILLTEFSSNTAIAAIGIPLAVPLATKLGINPNQMVQAIVYSASLSFMLPVATPPNAIIYSQKQFTSFEMARIGFVLNLIFAALIAAWIWFAPIDMRLN